MREDYDRILKTGWPVFHKNFVKEKILNGVPPEYLPSHQPSCNILDEWEKHGMPVLTGGTMAPPFEDPDTVYKYSSRLIRELGPEGFILQSGCDIPENAKLENVQAMVAAANAV